MDSNAAQPQESGTLADVAADAIRDALQDGAGAGDARYVYPAAWDALDALVAEFKRLQRDNEHAYVAFRELTEGRP